jgi:rhomboid protease GluP
LLTIDTFTCDTILAIMEVEKKFKRNYLTKRKFSYGKLAAFSIIGICLVLSNFYWDKSHVLSSYLSASQSLVFEKGEYWRLFTTSFVHGDLEHFLSNSLMLFILTYFVTSFYGVLTSIGVSFSMGMLINFITISQYNQDTTLVGASGIVYFLWGFWLILYVCIEKQMSLIRRLVRVMGIFFILLIPTTYSPNTSYMAHYVGLIIGMVNGLIYYGLNYSKILSFEVWDFKLIHPPTAEEIEAYQLDEPIPEEDAPKLLH